MSNRIQAMILASECKFKRAREYLLKAISEKPQHGDLYWLGWLSLCLNDFENSVFWYSSLLDEDPTDRSALYYLTLIYSACPSREIRDGALAIKHAQKLIENSPTLNWKDRLVIGSAHAENRSFQLAIEHCRLALGIAPTSDQTRILNRIKEYERSIPYRFCESEIVSYLTTSQLKCTFCGEKAIAADIHNKELLICGKCMMNGDFD